MDLAMAAMGSLLPKLVELLHGEYKLQKGVKRDVEFLEREMRSIDVALRKLAMVPRDKLNDNAKIWADRVRELSYEMEDLVDNFSVRVEDSDLDSSKRFMKKVSNLFKKGKTQHQIAEAIKDIKEQVQEVTDRRDRYKIDDVEESLAATTSIDPRLMTQFKDHRELVGIEEVRDELIKRLVDGDDCRSKQELKILSIFGFGGLGKTTLARAVYDKIQVGFEWKAFISVGQNPNLKNVLIGILFRLDEASCSNAKMLDEGLLIEKLRGLLANKRYLVIIDDIWDISSWDIIKCAFIDSKCGSRATESHQMDIFGRFSELVTLHIRSLDCILFPGAMDEDAFPKLRHLHLQYDVQPIFRRGAMPNLEFLRLSIKSRTSDVDFLIMDNSVLLQGSGVDFGSLENLPRLEKIDVDFHIIPALGIDLSQSNASLKHAVEIHPNHPTLTLKIVAGVPYWTETR
ncbi:hypothetical protein ZWY2020_034417 [Hordeum vulgare]|nr:hypothetical protein ZWY2020_034417 [Hordeum vulgare]